eukprot:9341775-Lingulodinium_polyedra.AAC.1
MTLGPRARCASPRIQPARPPKSWGVSIYPSGRRSAPSAARGPQRVSHSERIMERLIGGLVRRSVGR